MPVRPAQSSDIPGIARVHVDSWRTTYAGIMPDDFLAGLTYVSREEMWRSLLMYPREWLYVAEEDDAIVGFASCGPERAGDTDYTGELYAIYLLVEHQGKGIGRALAQAVVARLLEEGFSSMLVWVLANNPSRGFYEALGGQYLYEKPITIRDATLTEVAYGWSDINPLAKKMNKCSNICST
jgi:GNAT superfamily N-acetyltransferase